MPDSAASHIAVNHLAYPDRGFSDPGEQNRGLLNLQSWKSALGMPAKAAPDADSRDGGTGTDKEKAGVQTQSSRRIGNKQQNYFYYSPAYTGSLSLILFLVYINIHRY